MLMNPENRPRVMILIGKNKSFKTGRTSEYKIVITILAMTSVAKLAKPTVGSAHERIPSENAVIKIARNITCSIMHPK